MEVALLLIIAFVLFGVVLFLERTHLRRPNHPAPDGSGSNLPYYETWVPGADNAGSGDGGGSGDSGNCN